MSAPAPASHAKQKDESRLLDQFTRLLAYMGDEYALDGYRNDPSVIVRIEPLDDDERKTVVKAIHAFFRVDADIVEKVIALKKEADGEYSEQKGELIQYMADMADMEGGGRHRRGKATARSKAPRKSRKLSRKHSRK